jgi:ComF family protein
MMNRLLSTTCLLCQNKIEIGKNLCTTCIDELPWNNKACGKCAIPLSWSGDEPFCGKCLHRPSPFFDKVYAALIYQAPVVQMIGQFKFNQNLMFGTVLSNLLLTFLKPKYQNQPLPQAIIPVPLHPKRITERGYNQAHELAKPLGKAFNIPVLYQYCQRIKETAPQTITTSMRERRNNLRDAFQISANENIRRFRFPYFHRENKVHTARSLQRIAIIDDVLTTGSTIMMLAKALKKSGIQKIDVWIVAKTNPNKNASHL